MVNTQLKLRDIQQKQQHLEQENQFLKAQTRQQQPEYLVAYSPLMRDLLDTLKATPTFSLPAKMVPKKVCWLSTFINTLPVRKRRSLPSI